MDLYPIDFLANQPPPPNIPHVNGPAPGGKVSRNVIFVQSCSYHFPQYLQIAVPLGPSGKRRSTPTPSTSKDSNPQDAPDPPALPCVQAASRRGRIGAPLSPVQGKMPWSLHNRARREEVSYRRQPPEPVWEYWLMRPEARLLPRNQPPRTTPRVCLARSGWQVSPRTECMPQTTSR